MQQYYDIESDGNIQENLHVLCGVMQKILEIRLTCATYA